MSTRKRLVAIVDDDIDISILFRDALRQINGISVVSFTSSKIALEHFAINVNDYVLVISDLRMPGLNGMELLKNIKDMNPFVRTILITAFEKDDNLFREYVEYEIINGFLQKPVRLNDLSVEVTNQIHSYEVLKNKQLVR
jgi:two-component system response regulator (stage 0 sporulation protein F)